MRLSLPQLAPIGYLPCENIYKDALADPHLLLQFKAAQYLRLAEQKGSKTVGNSW